MIPSLRSVESDARMRLLTPVVLLLLCFTVCALEIPRNNTGSSHKVLILGGGVAGIIAARTLHQRGIEDFIIIEARPELGGRLMSTKFGNLSKGKMKRARIGYKELSKAMGQPILSTNWQRNTACSRSLMIGLEVFVSFNYASTFHQLC